MTESEHSSLEMPPGEFREHGRRVVDWVADYLEQGERHPVLAQVPPGAVARRFSATAPEEGTSFGEILDDFERHVVPGVTHWNHPGFMAYFATTGSAPGILAEALIASLNVNAMLWRTSPAATELEELAVDWLRQLTGLPADFRGHIQDTASTSTMVALAAARESLGLDVRRAGLAGREAPRLAIYCSREAHSSIDKAAITLGVGLDQVRHIETDDRLVMRVDALERAIDADVRAGIRPLAVVGTIGTTSTTSVDPIEAIADVCAARSIWLHVDAAYAGAAALVKELRHHFTGWERADSVVLNPHKWLFVPMDCSTLFFRRPEVAKRAFAILPEYLTTPEGETVTNLMEYGPALGRRFRGLKLWMVLAYFGGRGIAEAIGEHIRLARRFADRVAASPGWEVVAPVPFSTVCFRHAPLGHSSEEVDRLNAAILERVNAGGEVFLSHTRVRERMTLRLAVGNYRTTERHLDSAWTALQTAAASVRGTA